MSTVSFAEQENACLSVPSLKMRQRLHSAPENQKSTLIKGKTFSTPLPPSGRRALGVVTENATPSVQPREKKLLKPQELKVEAVAQAKVEELPDVETLHHHDPLEFQKYDIPEDVLLLRGLCLHGLASFPPSLGQHEESFEPLPVQPLPEMQKNSDNYSELDTFLQIIDELTIALPPEPFTD
ncbi:securin isoform X2 [Cynoglossus semilaevis]|uniref:Securin n=1 Tax=Cynoglossus semilaevis TaxID=244447 RepID=A0A3P8UL32_CYNSE|nr:securin isoform X2 [Cynoglossus semilaevis]XP_016894965.1 securin isoform X2 [Cynoglossus semilaevis]